MRLIYLDDTAFDRLAFERLMRNFHDLDWSVFSSPKELIASLELNESDVLIRDYHLMAEFEEGFEFPGEVFWVSGSRLTERMATEKKINNERFFQKPLKVNDIETILDNNKAGTKDHKPDLEYLIELSNGDEEFQKEMFTIFFEEVPVQTEYIDREKNTKTPDVVGIVQTVHALRSKLRTFGFLELDKLCEEIEVLGKKNEVDELRFHSKNMKLVEGLKTATNELKKVKDEMHNN